MPHRHLSDHHIVNWILPIQKQWLDGSQYVHIIRRITIDMLLFPSWVPEKKFQKNPLLDKAVLARALFFYIMCVNQTPWVVPFGFFSPVHNSIAWYCVNDTAKRLIWLCVFIEYLQKSLFLHSAYKTKIINEQLALNTFRKKKTLHIFSLAGTWSWQKAPSWRALLLQQTVPFHASLMGPQASLNIWQTRKPFPRAACAPLSSHLAIRLVFPSGTVAERQAQLPKSSVKIETVHLKGGSCFLTKLSLMLTMMLPKCSKLKSLNGRYYKQEMIPWKEKIVNTDILNI